MLKIIMLSGLVIYPLVTSTAFAGVVINGITISDSGKIIYLDKTEQGTATLKGDTGPKGDSGDKGDKGDKGDPGTPGSQVTRDAICQAYADDNLPAPPFCGKKIIFLTSNVFNGNLGGLSGADLKCQSAAMAAGLSGTFKAWLSDSSISAKERLGHNPAAYVRTDGATVANNWLDLTDGWLKEPLICDEFRKCSYASTYCRTDQSSIVYTGTSMSGDKTGSPVPGPGDFCNDWSSSVTPPNQTVSGTFCSISNWSDNVRDACGYEVRLYCIEQ